ncbi:G-type lectin S-receptor-like serine/threonine-protein kinase LECRK3 [Rosa rugosa]|uniref:G-type lectin S-receptor-like serine/threonine-protein kinase LECRK3 n=1 Tax=Rosa rugosa TaxID=74645 RepID=UPI002B4068AF|nr:G-type lectin S-receptor-like serine/threonine-protein kinase LECRK3 [Rosa rugosa]
MAFELAYCLCFLLVFLQLPFFTVAQSDKNISFSSSLTAQEDSNHQWASLSGEFAFGFRKISNSGFLLAIWFVNVHEKTIVWSANRNNPVQEGSTVEFSAQGKLTLTDIGTGKPTNIADDQSRDTGVAYAAMLKIQPISTNYSKGRFKFILDSGGNLMLYTMNYPLKSTNVLYWSIETGSGFQVIFNQSGSIYLAAQNGSILDWFLRDTVDTHDVYQRATLDYDGVLRHYIHLKSTDSSTSWFPISVMPSNICTAIVEITGGGACGFNSLCRHEDLAHTNCSCPPSYIPIDQDDERKGCTPNFVPQICDKASSEIDLFEVQELQFTDWPGGDYEHFQPVNKEQCKQSCLADCLCAVAIFDEGTADCWKKRMPLSNGRIDDDVLWSSLVKIRKGTLTPTKEKDSLTLLIIGAVIILISTNVVVFIIIHLVSSHAKVNRLYPVVQGMNLKCFTYMELKEATNGFEEELGCGAFATVFKGVLASDNGKFIAVKRLNTVVKENDLEFKAEVSAIGGTNHRNLVQLLGFCKEGQHQLLVYEYMSNGSLAAFLFGESRPNWNARKKIALGTARGLLYLHEECSRQIIHCDIKPQNILLDDSFTARIADFGVSKLLKSDQTRTTTRIRGTKGYVAPEWFKTLPVTVKVDVYSYGIVLLEIVCCRKNYVAQAPAEDQMILADWAYNCYEQKNLHLLLQNVSDDQAMDGIKELEKYLMIAFWCIQEDPSVRPTIKKVTQMLEGTVEVSVPPNNPSSLYVQSK